MKPRLGRFAVVTATVNPSRSRDYLASWRDRASCAWPLYVVWNGCTEGTLDSRLGATLITRPEILGVVPSFAVGVEHALRDGAQIICALHDDLAIEESGWDVRTLRFFDTHPKCGLLGFGGGTGLGDDDIYKRPYNAMQLARKDFISNLTDAESHGRRVTEPTRVSALDGFSQIGRREFWEQESANEFYDMRATRPNLFAQMAAWGCTHHFQDGMLGCFAARLGWQAWMLPILCRHAGGQTAVGEPRYAEWAQTQIEGGDQGFWSRSHEIGYREFADVLPLRV